MGKFSALGVGKVSGQYALSAKICREQARDCSPLSTGRNFRSKVPGNPNPRLVKSLRFRFLTFALFLAIFPFFIRRRPRVERRVTILATPPAIFPFLNDLRNWPLWTAWGQREEMEYTYGETSEGTGGEQRWRSRRMDGVIRITKSEADRRIDYEVEMEGGKYQMVGRIELQPDGACTRLVWRGAWELSENPSHRYFDLFLRWVIQRDLATGLENLKGLVETTEESLELHI